MKAFLKLCMYVTILGILTGCTHSSEDLEAQLMEAQEAHFSVGVLLPDVGLGDQSLNDLAVKGLNNARDELNIYWSYREATSDDMIESQLEALINEDHDVIIGVTYSAKEALEQAAANYPEQQFVLIDTASDIENIDAITFKENEGSYLAGVVAANASKNGVIGFVGGFEDPVILKFLDGFKEGAQSVKPEIQVVVEYANSYSDAQLGAQIASRMIADKADVLYAAAGYTGVGLLQEAQHQGVYAIGVDTDQYFYAEKSVITSMTKNVDVAIYDYLANYVEHIPEQQQILEYGIAENGVGLAPIRILQNANALEDNIEQVKASLK